MLSIGTDEDLPSIELVASLLEDPPKRSEARANPSTMYIEFRGEALTLSQARGLLGRFHRVMVPAPETLNPSNNKQSVYEEGQRVDLDYLIRAAFGKEIRRLRGSSLFPHVQT